MLEIDPEFLDWIGIKNNFSHEIKFFSRIRIRGYAIFEQKGFLNFFVIKFEF